MGSLFPKANSRQPYLNKHFKVFSDIPDFSNRVGASLNAPGKPIGSQPHKTNVLLLDSFKMTVISSSIRIQTSPRLSLTLTAKAYPSSLNKPYERQAQHHTYQLR